MTTTGRRIVSTLAADGSLTVEVASFELADPAGRQVLVRMDAAPINPSDLGALFNAADVAAARYEPGRLIAPMPEAAMRALGARVGDPMPIGNEGAGTVIAAGEDPAAQALLGKQVTGFPGAAFATHALSDAAAWMVLPDSVTPEQGAAAFVNPMTALGFVETMRKEGFTGIVHTAAASNLGQMLVKICAEDSVPLVNVVRSPAQVELLRAIGADHVLDSTAPGFRKALAGALADTGVRLGFDAIGGGTMAGTLLTAMEQAASRGGAYSRYGSNERKKVYSYGVLDTGPTVLNRSFGFQFEFAGWLLMPMLARLGADTAERMRQRVLAGLTTTFASHYKARVTLDRMLERDAVLDYNARRTGEKYLVLPNG
jgi:NADPH2:quinone reductase